MKHFFRAALVIFMVLSNTSAFANCGLLDFGCHTAKEKAQKTQAVIAIMKAGRETGWKNVGQKFTNKELAQMRTLGLDPSNSGLVQSLKNVNESSFADLDEETWGMVVDMVGSPEYVEKAIAKNKLGVDVLERKQKRLADAQLVAEQSAQSFSDGKISSGKVMTEADRLTLINDISNDRVELLGQIENLDSDVELTVLTSAISSTARTLEQAGVEVAQSIMDGDSFDELVEKAAQNAGVSAEQARETLQQAVSFGVSEIAAESLAKTDALGAAGNAAANAGDYATAAATDASARAQAAADRAAESAALEAAGLTEEAAKVAEIAQAEAELAAEAAQEAAALAAEEAANAAAAAEIAAQNAAIAAQAAAESAAQKADFIAQAIADGSTAEEAAQLASDAGY